LLLKEGGGKGGEEYKVVYLERVGYPPGEREGKKKRTYWRSWKGMYDLTGIR
jgi:hypothetical protein